MLMTLLKDTSSALGLFHYGGGHPGASVFERFFAATEGLFTSLGIVPTYVGLDGDGYPAGFTKFGGRGHRKAVKERFERIRSVSVAATPEGSDEPTFDHHALVSLGFVPSTDELLLSLEINEACLPFDSEAYLAAIKPYLALVSWSFGFGFVEVSTRQPSFHIQSLDPGDLTPAERTRLRAWYAATADTRLRRLRDVYAINLLGPTQLDEVTRHGQSLRALVCSLAVGKMQEVPGTSLMAWTVADEASRQSVRQLLADAGALVS